MRLAATTALLALGLALRAQGDAPLVDQMERLAKTTQAVERVLARPDRAGLTAHLDELQATALQLRQTGGERLGGERAAPWLDRLQAALDDLREPDATRERDRYDFGQLRRACTGCHLQVRAQNDERGLFPNRDNAVFGTLRVEQKDGTPGDEHGGVVVFLDHDGPADPPLPRRPVISQRGRQFLPAVLAVTVGTAVRFPNDDVVFHNVFSLSRGNAFDLDTYGKGLEKVHVMQNAGLVKVHCNIHPDMAANVLVLNTDRTGVSDASGFWVVPDVPDGDYTLRAWHPLAELHSQPIAVRGGKAVAVELVVRETRPRVQHTDKNGRPYKKKY
ncbi:MAG: hypothetical protein KDC48_16440 [Planctomycetes bacterium]|nr:hypothetical protein [Planctomycetota bacterium]